MTTTNTISNQSINWENEERRTPARNGQNIPNPTCAPEPDQQAAIRQQDRYATDSRTVHKGLVQADEPLQVHRID
ncbi:hypothetical protein QQ045_006670 [Rhodiola kirilowii]